MFPPCSMPSLPTIYSLSWRLWGRTVARILLYDHTPKKFKIFSLIDFFTARTYNFDFHGFIYKS
jgi:hypothetical protein